MKTRNFNKTIVSLGMIMVLAFSFWGLASCSSPQTGESETEETSTQTEELRVIGNETDTAVKVEVENATGKDIVGFLLKSSADEEYPESLVDTASSVKNTEKVLFCFEPMTASGEDQQQQNERAQDIVMRPMYDVALVFGDGATAELHDMNFNDLKSVKALLSSDGIAYIEYENEEGKTESTLEAEKAVREAAAQAEHDAAAQAAAEAEAAAQAEADAQAQAAAEASVVPEAVAESADTGSQNQYDYSSEGSSGGSFGGSSGAQSEDECVEDVVLR